MIDILKPSVPVGGTEHLGRIKPQVGQHEPSILNIPDPSKVTKANQQSVYSDRQAEKWLPNFQSNFDQFFAALKTTPGMTEAYTQLMSKMGSLVQSGISEGFAKEIASFMKFLNMSEGELLNFLKSQQGASVKFSGPFFDLLRHAVKNTTSPDLKGAIVDFLQKYDSMSSSGHVLNNVVSNLKSIEGRIPPSMATELTALIEKLITPKGAGGTTVAQPTQLAQGNALQQQGNALQQQGNPVLKDEINLQNLQTLKNQIVPFLSQYVGRTHDFGPTRDMISMFILNLSRYETGTEENFTKAFRGLMGYPEIRNLMEGVDIKGLEKFFLNNKPSSENNALVDKLINIISKGMSGEVGSQNKAVFQNVMNSLLINESVYMPLVHITLPADILGQKFFSEIWIDPDSESGESKQGGGEAIKLLIKFDIRDVGFFETIMLVQDGKIDMALFYPEKYQDMDKMIKTEIGNILEKNELKVQTLAIGKLEKPKTISEVFPKIYGGRNAVNVSV